MIKPKIENYLKNSPVLQNSVKLNELVDNAITNDVFGKIFLEFYEQIVPLNYFLEREDGNLRYSPSETYFYEYEKWNKAEQSLIQTIFDNKFNFVLDIGSGAVRVSLNLLEKGLDVVALDISQGAIEVCKLRRVKKSFLGSIFDYKDSEKFDCVILLGNNLGIGGSYDGPRELFNKCKYLTTSTGQIFIHNKTSIPTQNADHLGYHEFNGTQRKRIGEITFRLRYRTIKSDWFTLFLPTEFEFNNILQETKLEILKNWESSTNDFYVQLGKIYQI